MKATELRIGNLILAVGEVHKHLTGDSAIIKVDKRLIYDMDEAKEIIEPCYAGIPLTNEWLRKFSFNFKDYYPRLGCIQLKRGSGSKWSLYICSDANGVERAIEIIYNKRLCVHQLQNIYYSLHSKELKP